MTKGASYRHELGGGLYLDAFSIDPSITEENLREMVVSKDGKQIPNLESLVSDTIFVDRVNSIDELKIEISGEKYKVPEQLQAYREAVQFQSDSIGRYNGNVLIVDGKVKIPLKTFKGGFYDFLATKLDAKPSELENEFEVLNMLPEGSLFWKLFSKVGGEKRAREIHDKLKGKYKKGETIEELFKEWDIYPEKRARYFALAYIALTDNGNEISFVQRAKGMAIAADVISNAGSTPNPNFDDENFNINKYLKDHIIEEMCDEYSLSPSEFDIKGIYLFNDKKQVSFGDVEFVTHLKTNELAQRIYGKEKAIREHPVLYSISPNVIDTLIKRFPIWPAFVQGLRVFDSYNRNN